MTKGAFRIPVYGSVISPDPAIYCPANGFIPDPEVYVPPVVLPEIAPETIICICNAEIGGWRAATHLYQLHRSGGTSYHYEVFDNTGTLVDSFDDAYYFIDFEFPTSIGYYTVKISINGVGGYFVGFYNNTAFTAFFNDCVEAIILNTPNGIQFSRQYSLNFKNVEFANAETFEKITLSSFANRCLNFEYFKFPDGVDYSLFSGLSQSCFSYTPIRKIDMTKLNESAILNLTDSLFYQCKYLDEVIFPSNWSGKRLNAMLAYTIRLRRLVLPDTWITNDGTRLGGVNQFLINSAVEGELVFNEIPGCTTFTDVVRNCVNLEIIRLKGSYSTLSLSSFQNAFFGCSLLRIIEAPRNVGASIIFSGAPFDTTIVSLEEYIGPDVGYIFMPTANSPLRSITGEHDTSGWSTKPNVALPYGSLVRANLITVQMPKLRVNSFSAGYASNVLDNLNTLEIDWAGSPWASTTIPVLRLSAALPAAELNRIMTALPTLTGKVADLGWCTGYKDSDHTIANTKGWTVRGFAKIGNGSMSPIGTTTATFNGQMDYLGGYTPVTAGVCFRTTPLPTTANNPKNVSVTAEGAFTVNITSGLAANTTYYARAYATSTYGTVYGDEFTFTTLP